MSSFFNLRQNRINDPDSLELDLIDRDWKDGRQVIVQFSKPSYDDRMLAELNALSRKYNDEFGIRFYGHDFDCSVVRRIPNVRSLYVDCIIRAKNIGELASLENLERLNLGIYELREPEILRARNFHRLRSLVLSETKSKALNLEHLRNYKQLKLLVVGEHIKNIDAIGEIDSLEQLGLTSIKRVPLSFINQMHGLKGLHIILGGRPDLHEIERNSIEDLEIIWVRGFNDLSNIERFTKLRTLLVEDQIRLEKLHFAEPMPYLEDLKIINCKNFGLLTGLENLPSLRQLRIAVTNIDFDQFRKQKFPPSLRTLAIYTGREKKNKEIRYELAKMGYPEF